MEAKVTTKLEDIDLRTFCGAANSNIKYLKTKYPALTITVRGETLTAKGEEEEVNDFLRKMERLLLYMKKYGHISNRVIDQSFDAIKHEPRNITTNESDAPSGDSDFIVHGNNGSVIRARGENQSKIVSEITKNDLIFAVGPAGSGKTYIAIALAIKALKAREVKRVILTRPAVEAGEKLGYLPGDMKEKLDPYLQPLYDALNDMIPQKKLEAMMEEKIIQIAPLAYMRGRTLDNAFVILDEAQNTTMSQLKMFLTRMGKSSKFIVTGDTSQIDLPNKAMSGLSETIGFLNDIKGISIITMGKDDIVRHRLVKDIVNAFDKHFNE